MRETIKNSVAKTIKGALVSSFFLAMLVLPSVAGAQDRDPEELLWDNGSEEISDKTGLEKEDPRIIVARIINVFLGFLGIIALCLIMYAGFLWMTSEGSPDKINKAKKILIRAVIGLIIILSAFAIASFVLRMLYDGISGNGGGGGLPIGGGGGGGGTVIDDPYGNSEKPCSSTTNTCTPDDSLCASLGPYWICGPRCTCQVDNLGSCYNEKENVCNYPCTASYSCLGGTGCDDNTATNGCGQNDDSCQCCCNPSDDKCSRIYATLKCKEDSGSCSGPARGLCCGCEKDEQCGNVKTTGCGDDTCCNARPKPIAAEPKDGATDVCANALVSINFSQAIKNERLSESVLIIGDYGAEPCGKGTVLFDIQGLGVNVPGIVPGRNYCQVEGSYGTRTADKKYFVDFSTNELYKINTQYFIVVRGDRDINNDIDEGLRNYWGISMDGGANGGWSSSFTTINDTSGLGGVCVIENLVLSPSSYIFNVGTDSVRERDNDAGEPTFDSARDNDKLFAARAYGRMNQAIIPVNGYSWDWQIISTVSAIADFQGGVANLPASSRLVQVAEGATDGRSQIVASIDMTPYAASNVTMEGDGMSDTSPVFVFICNNPWPPMNPLSGASWEPWRPTPNTYNYEVYYCRDRGKKDVTVDDLPAFTSEGISAGSTVDNAIRQQSYFTYQNPPAPGVILGAVSAPASPTYPDGGAVLIEWSTVARTYAQVVGYKVYWGLVSGAYRDSKDVGLANSATISGLENGKKYYMSVTAYTADKAESPYYKEIIVTPEDRYGAVDKPSFIPASIIVAKESIDLFWTEVPSAASYDFAYGLAPDTYGVVMDMGKSTEVSVRNLSAGKTYYFAIRSSDASGNKGEYETYATSTLLQ